MATIAEIRQRYEQRHGPRCCATCAHYSKPGRTTGHCLLGPPSWIEVPEKGTPGWANWTPDMGYVLAVSSCERHSPAVECAA